MNKDFRKYDHPKADINSLSELFADRSRKDLDVPKLSKGEIERLRKSLFNESNEFYGENQKEYHQIQKPDYLIKNSEFLQKSNDLLSKIAKERNYRKSESNNRDIDNRLISDYRKAVKDSKRGSGAEFPGFRSKDELSLQNFGSYRYRSGSVSRSYDEKDSDRYRYELDGNWNKYHLDSDNDKGADYSNSEDEGIEVQKANAEGISAYAKNIVSLLAGYSSESLFHILSPFVSVCKQ